MSVQTIFRDANPTSQVLVGTLIDELDPPEFVEEVHEVFCLACLAPAAPFESWGGNLIHYAGDPISDEIVPYETDHAPIVA